MGRRDFIKEDAGSAATWPLIARAQQPVVGFLNDGSSDAYVGRLEAFREGLSELGYVDGRINSWSTTKLSGAELFVYRRVARAATHDRRKRARHDRTYPQQTTFQSQFLDYLTRCRGNVRRDGCRATTSDLTRHNAARRDPAGAPWRAVARYRLNTYPPATGSPPHLHANGVIAFVVSGTIVSKVGDEAEQTFRAGDAWWEPPGAIHRISRNASSTEPATLLAIYVAPKSATANDLMRPI